jgi:hypothetical protein
MLLTTKNKLITSINKILIANIDTFITKYYKTYYKALVN